MKNILALVLMVFGIVGCATATVSEEEMKRQFGNMMNKKIGQTEAEIVRSWGVPANQYLASDRKFLTYLPNNRCKITLELKNNKVVTYRGVGINYCMTYK